jgi:hypothetical protein
MAPLEQNAAWEIAAAVVVVVVVAAVMQDNGLAPVTAAEPFGAYMQPFPDDVIQVEGSYVSGTARMVARTDIYYSH